MPPRERLNRMLALRRAALFAAALVVAALVVAGVALFFLAGSVVWLKVFSGFMVGTGGTRLVVLARQSVRARRATLR